MARSLPLTIVIDLAVDLQPRLLLARRKMAHDCHQIAHHFLTNSPHQRRAFFGDAHHHLAPILRRNRPNHVSKVLKPCDESAGGGGGVPHLLRDGGHGEHLVMIQRRQQEELRKGDVARRKLLTETQDKAPLHLHDDVGEALGVCTKLISGIQRSRDGC